MTGRIHSFGRALACSRCFLGGESAHTCSRSTQYTTSIIVRVLMHCSNFVSE